MLVKCAVYRGKRDQGRVSMDLYSVSPPVRFPPDSLSVAVDPSLGGRLFDYVLYSFAPSIGESALFPADGCGRAVGSDDLICQSGKGADRLFDRLGYRIVREVAA